MTNESCDFEARKVADLGTGTLYTLSAEHPVTPVNGEFVRSA